MNTDHRDHHPDPCLCLLKIYFAGLTPRFHDVALSLVTLNLVFLWALDACPDACLITSKSVCFCLYSIHNFWGPCLVLSPTISCHFVKLYSIKYTVTLKYIISRFVAPSSSLSADYLFVSHLSPFAMSINGANAERDSGISDYATDDDGECQLFENRTGLSQDLRFLSGMPELCDVMFLVGEEREPVYGVKAILAIRSR